MSLTDELGGPNNKKWSLPLPVVTRSSESDSASSSWSARSADEATEDERSPVPSPSASTHSGDYGYGVGASGGASGSSNQIATAEYTANVCKTAELEDNKKLAMKAKHSEDIEYSARLAHEMSGAASSDRLGASAQSASKDDESDKGKYWVLRATSSR